MINIAFFEIQIIKIIHTQKKINSSMNSGFTLLELLAALLISSILVTGSIVGLQTILQANVRSEQESQARYQLNRAVDYIAEDVKTADQLWNDAGASTAGTSGTGYQDSSDNDWSTESEWLTNSSYNPVLYIRSPLRVSKIDTSSNEIKINDHRFLSGHAVVFTGSGVGSLTNINAEQIYYVVNAQPDQFEVASNPGGTAINLDSNPADVTANRLIVYYTRDNTSTWYGPSTLNRAAGICSHSPTTNCPTLIDAVNSFNATLTDNRQVDLSLEGVLNPRDVENGASPKTETLTIQGFARSN